MPVGDVEVDDTVFQSSVFSPKFIGLVAGALAAGLLFGVLASSSLEARSTYAAQTAGGQQVVSAITPKIAKAKEAIAIVAKLAPTKPDFDAAKTASEIDFVPEGGVLAGNGLRIGASNISNVMLFQTKAMIFKQALKTHEKLTNDSDRKEIDELLANEALQGDQNLAIVFEHSILADHLASEKPDAGYAPPRGIMVQLEVTKADEEGNVSYKSLVSGESKKTSVKNIVPVRAKELLKTAGKNNALTRYAKRVVELKRLALDLQTSMGGLEEGLSQLAERGDAPIIQTSSASAPSDAKKEEAPAEEAPAE